MISRRERRATSRRRRLRPVLVVSALAAAGAMARPGPRAQVRRVGRRIPATVQRRARFVRGRLRGFRYHVAHRHPSADVGGTVLADRVRSTIGPLEKRLDLPRVHVTVENGTVLLHGDVDTPEQATTIIDAVNAIAGVEGVRSHLHIGLTRGQTRPSAG